MTWELIGALGGTRTPSLLTLLCLSRTHGKTHRPGELPVELAGDVALEAAADLAWGLSLGAAPDDVGAGAGAAADPGQRDGVDGAVKGPVPAAVKPVPDRFAAAGSWNAMVTHRTRLLPGAPIDGELLDWLQKAYDQAG